MATATITKKKPNKKVTRRSAATIAEAEIVGKVWGPKMLVIITAKDTDGGDRPNLSQLVDRFNKEFKTTVSSTTVTKWLKILGWKYERVPIWKGLPVDVEAVDPTDLNLDPDTASDGGKFPDGSGPALAR